MKRVLIAMAVLALFTGPRLTDAAVINVDFLAETAESESVHSVENGVFSNVDGFNWNGVPVNVFDVFGVNTKETSLEDEFENPTPVTVELTDTSSGTDDDATNDLQDSGLGGNGFTIKNLIEGEAYDLAFYLPGASGFRFNFLNDPVIVGQGFRPPPTYDLDGPPQGGIEGIDYHLVNNVLPFDVGGGVFGFVIDQMDGGMMGFQLRASVIPEPATIALLGLSLAAAVTRPRRGLAK